MAKHKRYDVLSSSDDTHVFIIAGFEELGMIMDYVKTMCPLLKRFSVDFEGDGFFGQSNFKVAIQFQPNRKHQHNEFFKNLEEDYGMK